MPETPYERQFFVCTYGAWCRLDGSDEVRAALKRKVKEAGLASKVRITKSGCFGQCGHGPMAVSWPDNTWYCGVKPEDVDVLFEQHVLGGQPVEALRYHPEHAGTNKTDAVVRKERETGKVIE